MPEIKNIDDYLVTVPDANKKILQKIRKLVGSYVPEAIETISSHVPAFKYKGKYLISFRSSKKHLSFFVMRGNSINSLKNELKDFDITNVAIAFTPENVISDDLIKKILDIRVKEIERS